MKNPSKTYEKSSLDSKVLGATPHGLIHLLFQKLESKLSDAVEWLETPVSAETKVPQAIKVAESLRVASDIVQALKDSLVKADHEELFNQLHDLYAHIQYHILMATITQKPDPVRHALHYVRELISIWESIPAEYHHISSRS